MKRFEILAILLSTIILMGCGEQREAAVTEAEPDVAVAEAVPTPTPEPTPEINYMPYQGADRNVYGNLGSHVSELGLMVTDEEGNIYAGNPMNTSLSLIQSEESSGEHVGDDFGSYLNYHAGRIYYTVASTEEESSYINVYDISTGEREKIQDINTEYIQMVNGILYYVNSEDNHLCSFNPDTGEIQELIDKEVSSPFIYKDRIVYMSVKENNSLYSYIMDISENIRLTDREANAPIAYGDYIYYDYYDREKDSHAIRRVLADGSVDEQIADAYMTHPAISGDRLVFCSAADETPELAYIDLKDSDYTVHIIELRESLGEKYQDCMDMDDDTPMWSDIMDIESIENEIYLWVRMPAVDIEDNDSPVAFLKYSIDDEVLTDMPFYIKNYGVMTLSENLKKLREKAEEEAKRKAAEAAAAAGPRDNTGHNYFLGMPQDLAKQADDVAAQIAASIMGNPSYTTDLQRVKAAAATVAGYCNNAVYGNDPGKYYRSPVGVFITGQYTCAGSTRALGLIFEKMGFAWSHAGEGQWSHQWNILTIDGQPGFADGMAGIAGYGEYYSGIVIDGITWTFQ